MFGFGVSEVITIIIVCLVLINPKELPAIIHKGGKLYGKIMKEFNGIRKTFDNLEKEVETLNKLGENDDRNN